MTATTRSMVGLLLAGYTDRGGPNAKVKSFRWRRLGGLFVSKWVSFGTKIAPNEISRLTVP